MNLEIATASASQNGLLSSTDWNTFNNKQNALTNPVTGTGASGRVAYWTGSGTQAGSNNLFWDNTNNRLGVGTATPSSLLHVNGALTASSATLGYNSTFGNGVTLGVQGATASSINLTNYNNYTGTGNYAWVNINGGQFAPTSGSGQHSALSISQTINQTGTANGQVSGIVVSPTLTALNASIFYRGLQLTIPGTNNYGIYQTGAGARNYFQGSVGVGTATPAASAILEIASTTQGFLLPRMTTTERNAIASPATGLKLYNTTTNTEDYFNGTSWVSLSTGGGGGGVTTMAAIGSSPNANGATISGSTLNLQPASASFGGVLTNGTQTIGGLKTFNGNIQIGTGLSIRGSDGYGSLNEYGTGTLVIGGSNLQYGSQLRVAFPSSTGTNASGNYGEGYGAIQYGRMSLQDYATANSPLDASVMFQLNSDRRGFAPPRMTTTQRNAITSPLAGSQLYDNTLSQPHYRDGSTWQAQVGMTFGTAAPTSTPTAVGNFFLDTTNKKLYVATGTASSADWNLLN